MMNYIKTIFNTYKKQPKFIFGFHGELSHDSYNDIGLVDDDLYSWVKDLDYFGHLNNTILILMSDHGHRYGDVSISYIYNRYVLCQLLVEQNILCILLCIVSILQIFRNS